MGLWERHLLPRVINACNNGPHVKQVRERMCGGLAGEVVEIVSVWTAGRGCCWSTPTWRS